jgi:hypothetical protein
MYKFYERLTIVLLLQLGNLFRGVGGALHALRRNQLPVSRASETYEVGAAPEY